MHDTIIVNHPYETLVDVAQEPMLIVDEDGIIHHCNTEAIKYLSNPIGSSLPERFQNPSTIIENIEICIQTNSPKSFSEKLVDSNTKLSFKLTALPLFDALQPTMVMVSFKLLNSDLDQLEAAVRSNDERVERLSKELITVGRQLLDKTIQLAQQKDKLTTIINAMDEGLLGCDQAGNVIHCNENARLFLNLPDNSIIDKNLNVLCTDVANAIQLTPDHSSTISEKEVDLSINDRMLRIKPSCMRNKDSHIVGFILIIQDRTQEAELEHLKADIISIVSHELRSPLTSIKGYVDILLSGDLGDVPGHMREYLEIASANSHRLSNLIDDMLDISRIESGKLNLSFEKVDIKYLCEVVCLTMKTQAEAKKQSICLDVSPGLNISADMERLQQAITNLVSNAIKYTPENGTINITAKAQDQQIYISIQDNGMGISAEHQKRLFEKFFRVKNESTRNIGGTGLGLSITKSIVEAHHGKITVESKLNHGSTFTITLPQYLS